MTEKFDSKLRRMPLEATAAGIFAAGTCGKRLPKTVNLIGRRHP